MKLYNIVLIGAGNVATQIGCKLFKEGHSILQVYSRSSESASVLSKMLQAPYTTNLSEITDRADIYIYSVKDSALEDVLNQIPHKNGTWIHTSGSIPMDIFKNKTSNFGVIYPLQTFSKEIEVNWSNIPLFIESSNDIVAELIQKLATNLSEKVYLLSSENRKYIHLSGVFACNFVNYMYDLAYEIVKESGLSFDILLPLIEETCRKVHEVEPHDAQTGPAVRYDKNIINKHIDLLKSSELKNIYKLLSEGIHQSHKQ